MSVQMIARRYASALADVVIERDETREVQEELNTWERLIQSNTNLQEVFRNPTIALDQKRAVLNKLIERAKPRQTTVNFLKVLVQNHRLTELGEINRKFADVLDVRGGMIAARVTTETLTSLTGKKVRVSFATDAELIGGIVTRIGSTVYDGSVRNQLQQIKEKMAG